MSALNTPNPKHSGPIVVIGSANMDLVVRVSRLPMPGETLMGEHFEAIPGGKGANQAIAAARLGGKVAMVACVGDDGFGKTLRDGLTVDGINVEHVSHIAQRASGIAVITVASDGANSIVVTAGANGDLSPRHIDVASELIASAAMLICQFETPLTSVSRAIDLAVKHGTPVLLNPAPAQPLPDGMHAGVTYLVVNETEAELLTGIPVADVASARSAAARLREMGSRTVLVTLGSKGVYWSGPEGEGQLAAPKVKAVDSTAAGDTFAGGFAAALVRGDAIQEAVMFGQSAAAISVTRHGAQSSIPTLAEVEHARQQ